MKRLAKLAVFFITIGWVWHQFPQVGRALETPFDLARGLMVSVELHNFHKLIMIDYTAEGHLPTEQAFYERMPRRLEARGRNPMNDPWATAYLYRRRGRAYELRSAGPDRIFETPDDLTAQWSDRT